MRPLLPTALACLLAGPVAAQTGSTVVAQSELQTFSTQLQLVFIDTTYLTTLENLDDGSFINTTSPHQFINDGGGALVIERTTGLFRSSRLDLVNRPSGLQWQGPYVSIQPGRLDDAASTYDPFTPLDPWGEPYRLYTPMGLVDPIAEAITLADYGDAFGLYTVVSYGPDRQPMTADDLTRTLGVGGVTVPAVSSVRVGPGESSRSPTWSVTIRGENLGTATGTVSIDGEPVTAALSWSQQAIMFELPVLPPEGAEFVVQRPTGAPLAWTGYLLEAPPSAVADWALLE